MVLRRLGVFGVVACLGSSLGCSDDPVPLDSDKIAAIPETERWVLPGLSREVHVVRTEHDVPHLYAHDRRDLGRVLGFVTARDRFFMMDLSRRLGLGAISQLLGDSALEVDQESRGTGMTHVAAQIEASLDGELGEYVDAFAEGINAYIAAVAAFDLPPPSEIDLARTLLGASSAAELMEPFSRRDVAAMVAVVIYESSFEGGDVGRAATSAALDTLFAGAPQEDLRRAGAIEDLWQSIIPIVQVSSTQKEIAPRSSSRPRAFGRTMGAPTSLLDRLARRLDRFELRFGRDEDAGFGSNAWAVASAASRDGYALLAGDGHLSLSVPSILYRFGLDTTVFGRGDLQQLGCSIPGLPLVAIGTNGRVAWSQTQLSGDITDWYREELQLSDAGVPVRSRFQGEWRYLSAVEETYEIADVPLLDSVGRTERWTRWVTFDGRFIADIEGREASPGEALAPGETLVNLQGDWVVPGDVDGDGVITAISFDYAGFDAGRVLSATDAIGRAGDVDAFREATRGLVAYSQNFAVADHAGDVIYGAFQPFPCRGYLERNPDGSWADGSDPNLLLDGTRYGGFTLPIRPDGAVDDTPGADPYACALPLEALPQLKSPATGYVVTANNDPGGLTFDGSLVDDPHYIGGPWENGFRAETIVDALEASIAEGAADLAKMSEIQGDHRSPLGALFVDRFLATIDRAAGLSSPSDPAEVRLAALYASDPAAIDEVAARLGGWRSRGFLAKSGVVTTYHPELAPNEADDAVATMIFNAWLPRVIAATFDDEPMPGGVFQPSGSHGRVRALHRFLDGRGPNNPGALASYDPATEESVFFDVIGTPEVETSDEIILAALVDALAFLRSDPGEEAGTGGFGTSDMQAWRWGLRHYAKLESLLADFIGGDSDFAAITSGFAVSTGNIPLSEEPLGSDDPRKGLRWFPRPGDNFGVDAANPGLSGTSFSHGSGPVMRMVIALKGGEVQGVNILPGGQSSLTGSDFFADQARRWLANETSPMRFSVDQVVAGAAGREIYVP